MGQFGPTFAANKGIHRFSDSGVYVLGVLVSSTVFVFVVNAAGDRFAETAGPRGSIVAALAAVGLLMLIDAIRVWGGRSTSLGPARQTPYRWRAKGRVGVLGWGLDTGLPVSTVRTTPLPVLGVILAATGHAGPFHGLFYGAGVALGVLTALPALRSGERTDRAMDNLLRRYRSLGPARLVLASSGLTAAALAATLATLP